MVDFKKRSRGLAYVKLEDEESLQESLKEVERSHMDRTVKISKAKPLSEKTYENKPREDRPRKTSDSRGRGRGPRGGDRDRKTSDVQKRVYKPRHNDDNSVYVGNLSFRTTEMVLGRHFEKFGDIKDVRIVEDENERSRGFGYVEFEDAQFVEKALEADSTDLDGRKIRVAEVQKKERKPIKLSDL